jgi:hypothetical protein
MEGINGYEIILLFSSIATALTIYLTTRKRKIEKKSENILYTETFEGEAQSLLPVEITKKLDIIKDNGTEKKNKILNLENEIRNYVETRLLKAETEGKISYKDRMLLVKKYSLEIQYLEQQISNREIIFQQQEYENNQKDLKNIFNNKFNEINDKVNNIKNTFEALPKKEIKESVKTPIDILPEQQKGPIIKRKTTATKKKRQKNKAEERIENIQNEILKIVAQIEQIEIEG